MKGNESLLLTGTINPKIGVINSWYNSTASHKDARFLQYYKSILFYITQSRFNSIVFCDNSDYTFEKEYKEILFSLSDMYWKKLEIMSFMWSDLVLEKWYWYWEQEIIDYAYMFSKLLSKWKSWYKITWRYIIWNINEVLNCHKNQDSIFFRNIPAFFAINTAFFKVENKFFEKNLYGIWLKCNYANNINLESVYYGVLKDKKDFKWIKLLPIRINSWDDYIKKIHWCNIVKREPFFYDKILLKLWLYNL